MSWDLSGRVAVVTGAGSGIGRAIAAALAEAGAAVGVVDVNASAAEQAAKVIASARGTAHAFCVDVSDADQVGALPGQVSEALGAPNVVINAAGVTRPQLFLENDAPLWDSLVAVNLIGVIQMCQAFVRVMIDEGRPGKVVNIASDAGRVGSTGEAVYAGTKGGVIAFSKSLARELARHEITVNCVSPGPTDTPLFYHQPEKLQAALIRAIPLRRLAQPEEVAGAVLYLLSDPADYVTGQVMSVSGGLTMAD